MIPETQWIISPSFKVTFFCRYCGCTEQRHADGHCLFQATTFAYEPHVLIAKRILENRFMDQRMTKDSAAEAAAVLREILADLRSAGIPNDP